MRDMHNLAHILLLEDDDVDAEAVVRAFRTNQIATPISIAHDGIEALQMLHGEDGYAPLAYPYIILLDINLPRMNGIEFLHSLRQDPKLAQSVAFVLTTSALDEDKLAAYKAQIAGYFLKSAFDEHFAQVVELLQLYCQNVEFPPVLSD